MRGYTDSYEVALKRLAEKGTECTAHTQPEPAELLTSLRIEDGRVSRDDIDDLLRYQKSFWYEIHIETWRNEPKPERFLIWRKFD